ncbi:MAG: hypothetical protein ACE5OR_10745 [bacterium]
MSKLVAVRADVQEFCINVFRIYRLRPSLWYSVRIIRWLRYRGEARSIPISSIHYG